MKPRLGSVEVLVGEQYVFAYAVDQGATAVATDGVSDEGAEDLAEGGEDNHEREGEVVMVSRDELAAGEHPGVADGDFGAHGYAQSREGGDPDEREVTPRRKKVFH